jgi:hypothetical protein
MADLTRTIKEAASLLIDAVIDTAKDIGKAPLPLYAEFEAVALKEGYVFSHDSGTWAIYKRKSGWSNDHQHVLLRKVPVEDRKANRTGNWNITLLPIVSGQKDTAVRFSGFTIQAFEKYIECTTEQTTTILVER